MRTKEVFTWAHERHQIYLRRQSGAPKPWTKDPIMRSYRFCNVYRELDKVTIWIRENWRDPHDADPHIWFALAIARFLNLPASLEAIGYPGNWSKYARRVNQTLKERKEQGWNNFNGAYMVRSDPGCKIDYVMSVWDELWTARQQIEQLLASGLSLREFYNELIEFRGLGSFMAAQIIADLKYTRWLRAAQDWDTWAASGPGSRRGLNRVVDRPVNASWTEEGWLECLGELRAELVPLFKRAKMSMPHAQDVQSMLCEFDKYERARLGEGRPKQLYPGA